MRRNAKPQRASREPQPFAGLTFAVYARKSTEDARHEDHRSTARQTEQATRYVEGRGGQVLREHVYVDEDISGAEFKNRPGLTRLMNAVENGKPFTAVVMADQDRLGREMIQTSYLLQQITDAGVRVFYYMGDQEARLDSGTAKMVSTLGMFAAEMERDKARQRNRDKAESQARAGHVTGGVLFGYTNVKMKGDRPAAPGDGHDYVIRTINEREAKAVVGLFQMYAAGYGLTALAKTLNGAPAYRPEHRKYFGPQRIAPPGRRSDSWSPTAIREMLRRSLYRGVIRWGRTTKVDKGGRAGVQVRADRPVIETPAPTLQIVAPALWEQVQRRMKAVGNAYLRDTAGRLQGHPDRPDLRHEGRYLLSGIARCGLCGWSLIVHSGTYKVYGCGRYVRRGPTVCKNSFSQSVGIVDAAVLATVEEVLRPERFAAVLQRAMELVRERLKEEPERLPALKKEKADLERRIKRMVNAIGAGEKGPKELVLEIARCEDRVRAIDAELVQLEAAPGLSDADLKRIAREEAKELERWTDLLKGNVPRARQALKKLLVTGIAFTPVEGKGGKRCYRYMGQVSYGAVLKGTAKSATPPGRRRGPG